MISYDRSHSFFVKTRLTSPSVSFPVNYDEKSLNQSLDHQWIFLYKSCQNISSSVGITKSRAFLYKSCQNISGSVEITKSRAFLYKSCQNISTSSVEITKSRSFLYKSCQNNSSSVGLFCINLVKTALIYSVVTISIFILKIHLVCWLPICNFLPWLTNFTWFFSTATIIEYIFEWKSTWN